MIRSATTEWEEARCGWRGYPGHLLFKFRIGTEDSKSVVQVQIKCRQCGQMKEINIASPDKTRAPKECHLQEVLNGALRRQACTDQGGR